MPLKPKKPKESYVQMSEVVFPEHTNLLNHLMGGRLMYWMDVISFIVSQRHANRAVVTASVDNVSFSRPIQLGNRVNLQAQVTRAFSTSMEILVRVRSENMMTGEAFDSNAAFFTFVALDQNGRPTQVPQVAPQTPEEKDLYKSAERRRRIRLLLAKAHATEFDDILNQLESAKA